MGSGGLINFRFQGQSRRSRREDELGDDMKGTLRARFRQHAVWGDLPVFELHAPDPDGVDEA